MMKQAHSPGCSCTAAAAPGQTAAVALERPCNSLAPAVLKRPHSFTNGATHSY